MTEDVVKYYGDGDLSVAYEAIKAFALLDKFNEDGCINSINGALSLYNCTKFIEKKIWLRKFTNEDVKKYAKQRGPVEKFLAEYFSAIDETNVSERFKEVDPQLRDDLVTLVMKYRLPDRIPNGILLDALNLSGAGLHAMLQNKGFARRYVAELKHELLSSSNGLEYVVRSAVGDLDPKKFFLPELSPEEYETAINTYLDSENPIPNYVERIVTTAHATSDKTRLKAKRLHKKMVGELMTTSQGGVEYGITVKITDSQEEPIQVRYENLDTEISFSKAFLDSLTDDEALFSFIAGSFGVADRDSILTLPSYKSGTPTIEKMISNLSRVDYLDTPAFQLKQQATLMSFAACAFYLEEHGRNLESMLEWFFGTYLRDQFEADGFRYVASTSETYAERIKQIFSEMDSVIRQFSIYVENREIDPELLELSSSAPTFQELPSLVDNKYLYPNLENPEIRQALFLVCSDQSLLNTTKNNLYESSLLDLLAKHEINYDNFRDSQRSNIDWLIDQGILVKKDNIVACDKIKEMVLRQLNKREAIITMLYKAPVRKVLQEWQEKGWLTASSTLLTKAESDYYDFCMNNRSFPNSMAIRNKYTHGAKTFSTENEQRLDYALALLLMTGLMIKIHFDFALEQKAKKA